MRLKLIMKLSPGAVSSAGFASANSRGRFGRGPFEAPSENISGGAPRSEQAKARGRRDPEAYTVYVEESRQPRTKACEAYR
jgi:hypothetical protein